MRSGMAIVLAVLAGSAVLCLGRANAGDSSDVLGIRLAMSLEEAKVAAKGSGVDYEFEDLKYKDMRTAGFSGKYLKRSNPLAPAPAAELFDHLQVLVGDVGRVQFVVRNIRYGEGQRPEIEKLDRQLIEKYGEPAGRRTIGGMDRERVWLVHPDGSKETDNKIIQRCAENMATSTIDPVTTSMSYDPPQKFRANCPIFIWAKFEFIGPLVTTLSVIMFDEPAAFAEATARADQERAQKEEKAREELDVGKRVKTKL
jgi:hypothetical protein